MDTNEKAAQAVEEFIRTASPAEVVAAVRKASPDLFPSEATATAPTPNGRDDHRKNGNGQKR